MGNINMASGGASFTVTSVPLGGYADVFTGGDAYKPVGTVIQRSLYPEMSLAFPRQAAYSALLSTATMGSAYWGASCFGGGKFVAISAAPTITSNVTCQSVDGVNWNSYLLPATVTWSAINYGAGLYIALIGGAAQNQYATSTDGITWTLRSNLPAVPWTCIVYSAQLAMWCALGNSGTYATSTDGLTWTTRTIANAVWTAITCNPAGLFCAVAAGQIFTSPDGINWTNRPMPSGWSGTLRDVKYGSGLFIATSTGGTGNACFALTSPDGITWTANVLPTTSNLANLVAAVGDGTFLLVGNQYVSFTSPDGLNWKPRVIPQFTSQNIRSVSFGAGVFSALGGDAGTSNTSLAIYADNGLTSDYLYVGGTAGKYVRVR